MPEIAELELRAAILEEERDHLRLALIREREIANRAGRIVDIMHRQLVDLAIVPPGTPWQVLPPAIQVIVSQLARMHLEVLELKAAHESELVKLQLQLQLQAQKHEAILDALVQIGERK